jgi:hypothetical protein
MLRSLRLSKYHFFFFGMFSAISRGSPLPPRVAAGCEAEGSIAGAFFGRGRAGCRGAATASGRGKE